MLPVKKFRLPKDIPLEEYPKPEEWDPLPYIFTSQII
jgi:hypothetical protein